VITHVAKKLGARAEMHALSASAAAGVCPCSKGSVAGGQTRLLALTLAGLWPGKFL